MARGYLVGGASDAIIIVVDAGNIERNLYLTNRLRNGTRW